MALPKLPKLLDTSGTKEAAELGRRVYEWVSAAQDVLAALRLASIAQDATNADFETRIEALEAAPPGGVTSVFGRTGAVTAQTGDYTAAQVTGAVPDTRTITAGTGLTGGGDLSTNRTLAADFGSASGKICQGDDPRLSDSRAPTGAAGGDLASTYPNPQVAAIHETGGPTQLTVGAITDGQFLKRSGTNIISAAVFGSAGIWFPESPASSPHADDEEFTGTSIPSGWSRHDPNTLLTDTYGSGFAKFANATNATNQVRGIYRACPSAGDWSVWSKCNIIAIPVAGTSFASGLFLSENSNPSTGKIFTCGIAISGVNTLLAIAQTWTTYNTGAATSGNTLAVTGGFCRIGYDGTNFFAYWSPDGLSWIRLTSLAKTFTPTSAGLFCQNNTGNTTYHAMEFYRVKAASGASGINAGIFEGQRL